MKRNLGAFIVMAFLTAGSSPAMAQGRNRGRDYAPESRPRSASIFAGFGQDERRIIVDWFHDSRNLNDLPPGLAKREHLPPGLQKQLERNGKLPPGLQKKIQPLPRVLEVRLSRLPAGRQRIVIGGNVILMDETTSMIVDIIVGVF
jgi:hypothetical protein